MTIRARLVLTSLAVTIVLTSAATAFAQNYFKQTAPDGAILITQDAVFGSALPGDAPGFPITISQPGSYRLASNIVVPNANTTAIEITASHVSLDLNGFAILGPTVCSGTPVTGCSPTGQGVGILANLGGTSNVTVRNGTVSGMGNTGVLVVVGGLVERIHASHNGTDGVVLQDGALALNNTATRNGRFGLSTNFGSSALGNIARFNRTRGISADSSTGTAHNVVTGNGANDVGNSTQMDGNVCTTALCP